MMSYRSSAATNPKKPPMTAAPAVAPVPPATTGATGGGTGIAKDALGIPALRTKTLTKVARKNLFIFFLAEATQLPIYGACFRLAIKSKN
jgi:hypothetical protein